MKVFLTGRKFYLALIITTSLTLLIKSDHVTFIICPQVRSSVLFCFGVNGNQVGVAK